MTFTIGIVKAGGLRTVWPGLLAYAVLLTAAGSAYAQTTGEVTFNRDVAPILQQSCQGCHRAGQMGPMSLMTYEEVDAGLAGSGIRWSTG